MLVSMPKHLTSRSTRSTPQQRHEEERIMATPDKKEAAPHLLVVIDHQEARVYRTEVHGAVPVRIVPFDPHGYGAVAKTLRGAEQVLLFGSGTGRSSAMEQLLADLKDHHPDVAEKVIGSVHVDAHDTTENQLLAKARDFYAEFNRK
jgi:hypothetical protein